MVHINIEIIDSDKYWIKHPTYDKAKINDDSGLDIPMNNSIIIPANSKAFTIKLGIKCEPSHGFTLLPRSSICKTPLRLSNSVGIIDKSYRGELMAKVDNISEDDFKIEIGKCYFQIVAFDGYLPSWNIVDSVNETKRGEGGFGSSTEVYSGWGM